jgi:nucleotidyltransferase/DNA polymerase involved in DNA repair
LRVLAADVVHSARAEGVAGRIVTLKVRCTRCITHTRQHRLGQPTDDERVLFAEAKHARGPRD